MKNTFILAPFSILWAMLMGCAPAENAPQNDASDSGQAKEVVQVLGKTAKLEKKPPIATLMEMERRDGKGNVVGLNEKGLWYKRGENDPYTGIIAGYYKAKGEGEPVMASKREYKHGIQVGTETGWYTNGKKRIELAYENGEAISMRQWDADGKELGNNV